MLNRSFSRREALKLGALGVGSVLLPLGHLHLSLASSVASPPVSLFKRPLPIPVHPDAVFRPVRTATVLTHRGETKEADVYELEMRVGFEQVLPPEDGFGPTRIWGYARPGQPGRYPGPTFLVRRGRPLLVKQTNRLTEAETGATELGLATHEHGGNVDGFSDGHPLNLIRPGKSKLFTYFSDQPNVTMWYHDHAIRHTARNVYKGLAGFYLLSDDWEDSRGLPRNDPAREEFFDIPLLIQDGLFSRDGSEKIFPPGDHPEDAPNPGVLGDTILVNGRAWPVLEVQRRKYRFRFLNGSNAREYVLALSSGQSFIQIGTEGGLLPRPLPQPTIRITQAERYDVVVDFKDSPDEVVLQNLLERDKLRNVMLFRVKPGVVTDRGTLTDQLMEPSLLAAFNTLRDVARRLLEAERRRAAPSREIARFRQFKFDRSGGFFTINNRIFDEDRDDADPKEGDIEVWTFQNDSGGWFHPGHPHLLHAGFGALLFESNRGPVVETSQEWGWKETFNVARNRTVRIIMRWPKVPINPANPAQAAQELDPSDPRLEFFQRRYVFHCHNTDHEDHDMMGQIRVDAGA